MTLANTLIGMCWIAVILVWFICSKDKGKYDKQPEPKLGSWIRFLLFAAFVLCISIRDLRVLNGLHLFFPTYFIQALGVFLCILGVCLAIKARIQLGKGWGMPMTQHQSPILVTTGPYRIVRHPTYAGLCLAMLGSMFTPGALLFLWYLILILYFIYSAIQEEKFLSRQFPNEYAEYKRKTKMIVPFIL